MLSERTSEGPTISGTFAQANRLHDDKSTYTGVYVRMQIGVDRVTVTSYV